MVKITNLTKGVAFFKNCRFLLSYHVLAILVGKWYVRILFQQIVSVLKAAVDKCFIKYMFLKILQNSHENTLDL